MFKIHQFYLDRMCALQAFFDRHGFGNLASNLKHYNMGLIDKQVQRRADLNLPVISCSVEWGTTEVKHD